MGVVSDRKRRSNPSGPPLNANADRCRCCDEIKVSWREHSRDTEQLRAQGEASTSMKIQLQLLLLVFLVSCADEQPSTRPAAVPENAVYVGNEKGGSYVLCEVETGQAWNCTVFNISSGEVEDQGSFVWRGKLVAGEAHPPYVFFNGATILTEREPMLPVGRHVADLYGSERAFRVYELDSSGEQSNVIEEGFEKLR